MAASTSIIDASRVRSLGPTCIDHISKADWLYYSIINASQAKQPDPTCTHNTSKAFGSTSIIDTSWAKLLTQLVLIILV